METYASMLLSSTGTSGPHAPEAICARVSVRPGLRKKSCATANSWPESGMDSLPQASW